MARVSIPQPTTPGRIDVIARNLALGYGERTIIKNTSFEITSGDKVAIVGENGAGKSTLVRAIAGRLDIQSGSLNSSASVRSAYYAQHVAAELPNASTIIDVLLDAAPHSAPRQQILDLAGSLLFSGDDVKKRISNLSGGEKARVALGKILLSGSNLLILDEPTNHLDFYTVEALAHSLHMFRGNVIFVSHDQTFVKMVATKIIEVRDGFAHIFHGSYDDYIWSLRRGSMRHDMDTPKIAAGTNQVSTEANDRGKALPSHREDRDRQKQAANQRRRLERRNQEIESRLEKLQSDQDRISAELSLAPSNPDLIAKLGGIATEMQNLETEWIDILSQLS